MSLFIQSAYAASGAATQPSFLGSLLLPIAFFAIFYFLIIRPQSKRNKEHRAMVEALKAGDEVVFAGGLMGTVKKIDGEYAVIAVSATNELKVQRACVISVLPAGTIANI